jgi:hypothetical protein
MGLFSVQPTNTRLTALWIISNFWPLPSLARQWQEAAWEHWELNDFSSLSQDLEQSVAVVNLQKHTSDTIVPFLEATYGIDWRRRPLLLQNLWTAANLSDPSRRLSQEGLLQEDLTLDYFTDARREKALVPDGRGRVRDIVANMTDRRLPHKIASQSILDTHPERISEVAPAEIIRRMFGDHFQAHHLQSWGPFGLLPPTTTVPVFVAPSQVTADRSTDDTSDRPPHTALHCEPIGNVAVQLSGRKSWTLVAPEFSHALRPAWAPDGRAYVASWMVGGMPPKVPHSLVTTAAGDALWVPTWTWHQVEYDFSAANNDEPSLAIGASLFHFRPMDYVRNNPLYAALLVPALVQEVLGWKRQ